MLKFRLIRSDPTKLEVEITSSQLISMLPIEIQEHPVMGEIERVWLSDKKVYSVKNLDPSSVEIHLEGKHIKISDEKMLSILQTLEKFEIALYYEGKVDKYIVEKIKL